MPTDWTAVRLGDLVRFHKGVSYQGKYLDMPGPKLLGLGTIVPGGGSKVETAREYSGPLKTHHRIRPGEIYVALTDLTQEGAVLGSPAIVPQDTEDEFAVTHHVARLEVVETKKLDTRFLYYLLRSPEARAHMRAMATGTTVRAVAPRDAENLIVELPPFGQQEAIAAVLGALDDKIELNRRMSETLEEISATYFKTWLQDSGIGQGPVEGTLADIIEFDPPERLRRGTEAPYLGLAQIPNSGMIHEAPDTRAYTSGARFRNGDTLFARITPSLENGKTAIALGLGSNTIAWGSTELIVMRPKKPVPALVPYLISRDPAFRAHAVQNMSGTSGRQRVPREALMRYAFPASSHQDWQHLNRLLSPVVDAVWTRAQESRTLAELRDALLPKLISGELHIPEAEQVVSEVA